MKEFGVDILRTVNVERSQDFKPGDAEVIICMTDFISHTAYNAARGVARKHSRPFIAITRKAAEWDEKFKQYKQQAPQLVAPAPASSRTAEAPPVSAEPAIPPPPDSEPQQVPEMGVEQFKELLEMFEAENTRLEGEIRPLMKRLEDTDALASALEKRVEQSVADAKEAALDFKRSISAHRAQNTKLSAQVQRLEEEKVALESLESAGVLHSGTVEAFQAELEELRGDLTQARATLTETAIGFDEVRQALAGRDEEVSRLQAQLQQAAQSKPGIDKEVLLSWDRLLRGVRSGNAPDFQALLEFSVKADISPAELLALLKG